MQIRGSDVLFPPIAISRTLPLRVRGRTIIVLTLEKHNRWRNGELLAISTFSCGGARIFSIIICARSTIFFRDFRNFRDFIVEITILVTCLFVYFNLWAKGLQLAFIAEATGLPRVRILRTQKADGVP